MTSRRQVTFCSNCSPYSFSVSALLLLDQSGKEAHVECPAWESSSGAEFWKPEIEFKPELGLTICFLSVCLSVCLPAFLPTFTYLPTYLFFPCLGLSPEPHTHWVFYCPLDCKALRWTPAAHECSRRPGHRVKEAEDDTQVPTSLALPPEETRFLKSNLQQRLSKNCSEQYVNCMIVHTFIFIR